MTFSLSNAYVGKGAAGFGEMVRNSIFIANRARAFCGNKNLIWYFALIFCFFLIKQKESIKDKVKPLISNDLQKTSMVVRRVSRPFRIGIALFNSCMV